MKVTCALLLACFGATSLCAQQADSGAAGSSPAAPAQNSRHHRGQQPQEAQPEQKPATYLGLIAQEVPAELRAQLSLPEGFGLLVREVMLDSPAQAAGLKTHDVLVRLEDQQLVNMEQLMALVHARKKGDVVKLYVISGGKETQVSVTLGEHLLPPRHGGMFREEDEPRGGGFLHQIIAMQERLEQLQQQLREHQERLQQWSKNGMPAPRRHGSETGITMPPGASQLQWNFSKSRSSTNTTRRDESGEYTLKTEDGKKIFTVRPTNGKEQSWPIDTEDQRQAVPPEFREKLKLMDSTSENVGHKPAPEKLR